MPQSGIIQHLRLRAVQVSHASPGGGWGGSGQRIFGNRQSRTGGRYRPVLIPQPCHDVIDRLDGDLFARLSQVGVDRGRVG